ncbi:MAG: glycosyltransferase family 2 protein [Candidatus Nezhaarchaeales archaeon]
MASPRVSIIWLNYNSMKMIDLALRSLNAVSELDYPSDKYEVIVVDNCSTDGSFEKIKEFLEKRSGLRKKIIRLNKNLGFTGGNNVGFRARDKESKYVVLLNNDAIPFKESLETMVEYAEQYDVGGLMGIILKYNEDNVIDTAGDYMDEMLTSFLAGEGRRAPWIIRKPFYVTYADGAYALYNVSCVLKSMGERLFFDEFFGYGDDNVLGLMLWNNNYRIISIPKVVATHSRGSTFGKGPTPLSAYLDARNRIALLHLTNAMHKNRIWLHIVRTTLSKLLKEEVFKRVVKAYYNGVKLGKVLRRKYNLFIDIYKAPILRVSLREFITYYVAGRRRELLAYNEKKMVKHIKKWEVD